MDTLKHADNLFKAGVPRELAETHIRVLEAVLMENLATKDNFQTLRVEIKDVSNDILFKLGVLAFTGIFSSLAGYAAIYYQNQQLIGQLITVIAKSK